MDILLFCLLSGVCIIYAAICHISYQNKKREKNPILEDLMYSEILKFREYMKSIDEEEEAETLLKDMSFEDLIKANKRFENICTKLKI